MIIDFNKGADINRCGLHSGQNALILLLRGQADNDTKTELTELFIEKGINLNLMDKHEHTALYYAKEKKLAAVIEILNKHNLIENNEEVTTTPNNASPEQKAIVNNDLKEADISFDEIQTSLQKSSEDKELSGNALSPDERPNLVDETEKQQPANDSHFTAQPSENNMMEQDHHPVDHQPAMTTPTKEQLISEFQHFVCNMVQKEIDFKEHIIEFTKKIYGKTTEDYIALLKENGLELLIATGLSKTHKVVFLRNIADQTVFLRFQITKTRPTTTIQQSKDTWYETAMQSAVASAKQNSSSSRFMLFTSTQESTVTQSPLPHNDKAFTESEEIKALLNEAKEIQKILDKISDIQQSDLYKGM